MEAMSDQEVIVINESVSLLDKLRASVAVAAAGGELGVIVGGVIDTGSLGGKAILAAGAALILQGVPSLNRIDTYQRHNHGIW
jgi:hypothetical protein